MIAQTPQRPLPGAYIQTPAASRFQSRQPFARTPSSSAQQQNASQSIQQQSRQNARPTAKSPAETLAPVDRALRTINDTLISESRYPELDTYLGQGISSEYDISSSSAWAPFEKLKVYPIPDRIFEQYNRAQVSTMMGLFADINHAWITIDNACYLWDYTHPAPDLVGFEEQNNSITAVRLVTPRPGCFVGSISKVLLIATTMEMFIIGVAQNATASGAASVELYKTNMKISIRGLNVTMIEGVASTGRVFFSGMSDNDIYELVYQQSEGWFSPRCTKIKHTGAGISAGVAAIVPSLSFKTRAVPETTVQIAVDDARKLIYTLSSTSTIRTFHMKTDATLDLVITKTLNETLKDIGHMTSTSRSELISPDMKIVSIHPISSQEASKIHLMVTTSTGCRISMSGTSAYGYAITNSSQTPSSMQVQHVKFPPPELSGVQVNQQSKSTQRPQTSQQPSSTQITTYNANQPVNISSKSLKPTRTASRYSPGYFFCFVTKDTQNPIDTLFISAPDTARIAHPQDTQTPSRCPELGLWINLGSRAEDVGLVSRPFSAGSSPVGFANELAVQFDKPAGEIAILTNTGIHTYRRRRLVDMFASTIRLGGGEEGLEGEVKRLLRLYGRGETAATALAVACGQGLGVTPDSRLASILDPDVIDFARRAFVEYGGKPLYNDNTLLDAGLTAIDMVRPSPRHEGLSLYIARLVRSIWKAKVAVELQTPTGGLAVLPSVALSKLREVQENLSKLKEFLTANKSFIEGLAGPEALGQVSTVQEEIALQAEHRALNSLVVLIQNMIEGISFVLVLFDERIEEVVLSLPVEIRLQVRDLTYEVLFCTGKGKELAKELVKAIVNRNIANGSNVDTVAEALRRRCGSFCSAQDVIIFKAQEQLKRAAESGTTSELGRNLLNESLRLFKQVVADLSMEQLQWAIGQYVTMHYFAGAIQLALDVAQELDRGNRALIWIQDGRPEADPRAEIFEKRKRCYNMIHYVIQCLDESGNQVPDMVDGQYTPLAKRRSEAFDVIDSSEDEVFQTDLYDWYLQEGRTDRLMSIDSPFLITYLERKSLENVAHADLLWKYHSQGERHHDAAKVQLELANSNFNLSLDQRIGYLGRAKANASTYRSGVGRQTRSSLLRKISDLLDVANLQGDLLQRLKGDDRIAPDAKQSVVQELDGPIKDLSLLFNAYVEPGEYFDLAIMIYHLADHRNPADISRTWQNLVSRTHTLTVQRGEPQPYEAVSQAVRTLGSNLNLSETTFPVEDLLPILERYAFNDQRDVGPRTWVIDTFLDLEVSCESLYSVLESMYYSDDPPFVRRNVTVIANDILYVAQRWFHDSNRGTGYIFGSDANATAVLDFLLHLQENALEGAKADECQVLRTKIAQLLR